MPISLQDLLGEVEDLLRTAPPIDTLHHRSEEVLDWLGRTRAVFSELGMQSKVEMNAAIGRLSIDLSAWHAAGEIMMLVKSARHKLRLSTAGPLRLAVDKGMIFDYFDALRSVIEEARSDVFFIDPWLDADIVKRYLPFVKGGVVVRMLARERVKTLMPAVSTYAAQEGLTIEVRSGSGFHDRWLFIDGSRCFQSGASFKDGGLKTPTTLIEIAEAKSSVMDTYERLWTSSPVVQ
ncbi:hypothetical protein E5S70_07120 [Ensifer adhaerens]|uniref:hypothetical protein n=1 Tax=Ensifer canadensis TaxID=555315 RepID=UPI00148F8C14|nr:hypothetical protein [Ensifer canadensis]NOV15859.1 hypothetical protein [Ensifer canadensis]